MTHLFKVSTLMSDMKVLFKDRNLLTLSFFFRGNLLITCEGRVSITMFNNQCTSFNGSSIGT